MKQAVWVQDLHSMMRLLWRREGAPRMQKDSQFLFYP